MGSLYQRGATWWIQYYAASRKVRESARTTAEREARTLLAFREGALARGEPVRPNARRLMVSDLLTDLLAEYRTNGRHSLRSLQIRVESHLRPALGRMRATELTTAECRQYIAQRQEQNAANATINRELAALKRAYHLAVQDARLAVAPHIPLLRESNVRTGFFEAEQFEAVCRHLPDDLKPVAIVAYITGWRVRSELLPMQWRQVDFAVGELRLDPGTTKNTEGRVFPLTDALRTCLETQRTHTAECERRLARVIPWVFHRDGRPIRDFRKAWKTAVLAAGVPGRIPHDFRRTAIRNLELAGVPRAVAMKLTGHRTESCYRRYAIVSHRDLTRAAEQLNVVGLRD